MGVVISLASWASSLAGIPISLVTSPIWSLITISFLLYRSTAEKRVSEIDIETAKFWSDHCTPGKTFAATLTRSFPKVTKKIHQATPLTDKALLELEPGE